MCIDIPARAWPAATDRLRVAVTGHQHLGDTASEAFVQAAFAAICAELARRYPSVTIYSGLAAGADTLFAEAGLAHGLRLEAVLAAADISENFAPGDERDRFDTLCRRSAQIHRLPSATRSEQAYLILGHWLVAHCDLLVAAWNGLPAAGLGGTGDVVAHARQQGGAVLHVHPGTRCVEVLTSSAPQMMEVNITESLSG